MDHQPVIIIVALASIFLFALFIGRLVAKIHIPRVTGYLFTGLLIGPSFAKFLNMPPLLSHETIVALQIISDLALVLILLSIGMRFKGQFIQRWRRQIMVFSIAEIVMTCILVFVSVLVINLFFVQQIITGYEGVISSSLYIGITLAILSIATAPAATLMVIREYGSEGPITDMVTTLVGLNNFFTIITFIIMTFFLFSPEESLIELLLHITAPLLIGIAIGFFMSIWAGRLENVYEYQLLVFGGSIAILGTCSMLEYDYLLTSFSCGVVLVNSSPKSDNIIEAIRKFDYALYVIFFVLAGANLHLDALGHIGLLGIAYIIARTAGKLFGCRIGAKFGGFSSTEKKWTGFAMVAQAGVAIGLCNALYRMEAPGHELLVTIVLGSVVIFELLGPTSIRFGLIRAGEVPLLTMLAKKAPVGSFEGFYQVINFFRSSLGIPMGYKVGSANDILVKHIMRTNVNTVHEDVHFDELLHFIAHSNYDRFPVIDKEDRFIGVIDYSDIRDVLFDPILENLILAIDLVSKPALVINPEDTLGDALKIFKKHKDISYLPVVDKSAPDKLLGIINQNDVLAAFRKFKNQ